MVGAGTPGVNEQVIVPATRNDLPQILEIERASFTSPWPAHLFETELNRGCTRFRVLRGDPHCSPGPPVGYIVFWLLSDKIHLLNLAVHPKLRRQGAATVLLEDMLLSGVTANVAYAHLEVRAGNESAVALYEGAGFVRAGYRPGYYPDTGEDAVTMVNWLKAH